VVKSTARQFIHQRIGDRLGLILFGSQAYLQTPLTFDHQTVLHMLNDTTVGLAGKHTAIGNALGLAIKQLKSRKGQSQVIVLLTDGSNNAGQIKPIQAAKMAAKLGIKIYTIGIGANRLVVNGIFGSQVVNPSASLDEQSLKHIANLTGGVFFRAQNTQDLRKVYRQLNQLEPIKGKQTKLRSITPLYPWPLGLRWL
jgi:Ca-activated chloride channel family protein